jgi:hypothetical protein
MTAGRVARTEVRISLAHHLISSFFTRVLKTHFKMASEQPPEIAFTAALAVVPAEDWGRTWAADRTIMLRMTSKRVKELVDKMRLPAVVRRRRSFLKDELARGGMKR